MQLPAAIGVTVRIPLETAAGATMESHPLTANVAPAIVSVTATICVCPVPLNVSAEGDASTVPAGIVGLGLDVGEELAAGVGDELGTGVGDELGTGVGDGLGLGCGG